MPTASISSTLFTRKMLICIFTGLASGLPLFLLIQLVPAWLQQEGINIKTIGAFALTQLPYVWKFVAAPFMDRYSLFGLGRRRGWMLLTQIGLIITISLLGFLKPGLNILLIAALSFIIALFSALQDVAIDAFRRELLTDNELGLGSSIHINAYRVAGLIPGSLSLILASFLPWQSVFIITALFMIPAIFMTLLVKEPIAPPPQKMSLTEIIINPFTEFFQRSGLKMALLILAFIFFYKLGDGMATSLASAFYLEMGFSLKDVGLVAKNAGLWPSVIGALLGGILMTRIGINKALWLFGVVQLVTIGGFVILAMAGPFEQVTFDDKVLLATVIACESLGVGLGNAAFIAFIARATNPLYTATQFALFTSLTALPRTFIHSATGAIVESIGWTNFFYLCILLAVPGMLLLFKVAPWHGATQTDLADHKQ